MADRRTVVIRSEALLALLVAFPVAARLAGNSADDRFLSNDVYYGDIFRRYDRG